MDREIYLDNSSTTRVCQQAAEKVLTMMTQCYGNPSSLHHKGNEALRELSHAREQIARVLHAAPEEILFTSGGTEANNLAVFGAAKAGQKRGRHIVTTAYEHSSVLACMQQLEKEGWSVTYLKPDQQGHITAEQVEEAITPDTVLVSMMAVNNEIGTMPPLQAVPAAIRRKKAPALFHVDAVQAFGKMPLNPARMGIDLLTCSSHKIHGPKGAGALYHRRGIHILPRQFGGEQENRLRPGTEAVPALCGFGAAVAALPPLHDWRQKMEELNTLARRELAAIDGVTLHSPLDALPCILHISAGHVRAQTMLNYLSQRGIFVSSGSACAKGARSHVLVAMGLPQKEIDSSLRISFSYENTPDDIHALCAALQSGLQELIARP